MSSPQSTNRGYKALKKSVHAVILVLSIAPFVRNALGMVGNPMLQVGGEQDAVTVAEPGLDKERLQDWVHAAVPVPIDPGCEDVQVSGTLLRTIPPSVFGRELLPMMSVTVAMTVCEPEADPLGTLNVVRPDPAAPSSSAMV